ncbi:hypothetical protein GQ607_015430, partial [Colletotrichum asianum]
DGLPCPTITTTGFICPTFPVKACARLSTISSRCDCPTVVPTSTVNFPCDGPLPTDCQLTIHIFETAKPDCGGVTLTEVVPTNPPLPTICPTVTKTTSVCSTCIRPLCLGISTIYNLCGCPTAVPTTTAGFPCGVGCPGGCAGTEYIYASNTPSCSPSAYIN